MTKWPITSPNQPLLGLPPLDWDNVTKVNKKKVGEAPITSAQSCHVILGIGIGQRQLLYSFDHFSGMHVAGPTISLVD